MTETDPTPLDEKIREAEEAEREAEERVTRSMEARQEAETPSEESEAMQEYLDAADEHTRAKARLNALRLARDRWRRAQKPRYFDPEHPETPMTRDELDRRLGRR